MIPAAGVTTFLGIAGVYAGFWGVLENRRWLYFPCVLLMQASYAIQFAALRRGARGDKTAGIPDSGSRGRSNQHFLAPGGW